jgi:hypothetical protein
MICIFFTWTDDAGKAWGGGGGGVAEKPRLGRATMKEVGVART